MPQHYNLMNPWIQPGPDEPLTPEALRQALSAVWREAALPLIDPQKKWLRRPPPVPAAGPTPTVPTEVPTSPLSFLPGSSRPPSGPPKPFVPSAFNPSQPAGGRGMSITPGSGPTDFNTEAAVSGLRAAGQRRLQTLDPYGSYPTSELFGLASRDPGSVAPGANQFWQQILDQRRGPEAANQALQQKIAEMVQTSLAQVQPPVSTAMEAQARQKAYPAMETASGMIGAADIGAGARTQAAAIQALQQSQASQRAMMGQIGAAGARGYAQLGTVRDPDEEMLQQLQALIEYAMQYGQR